jgi:hypothetical protein
MSQPLTKPEGSVHTGGRMHRLPVRLVLTLLAVAGLSRTARAAPIVYASLPDDGVNHGIVNLPAGSGSVALALYLDPGEFAFEYLVGFEATAGLLLESFLPENASATVNFDAAGGTLALSESLGDGSANRVRLGSLVVRATLTGGELRLADLPDVAFPALTNAAFELTPIPVPQFLARVPEPRALLPVWIAALAAARALRRTRTRSR